MVPETETLTEIIQDTNGEDMTVYVETYYVPYLILGDKDTHYPLEVYARSERNGLVMLSMSEAVDIYEPAELRVFTGSELIGEHAMLASFSLCTNIGEGFNDGWHDGYNNRISTGHSDILAVNGHDVTKCGQQIVMDLEATPGEYGGAIIDSEGRLLGIVCKSAVAEYEGDVCAVSSNEIIDFLNVSFYGNTNNEKETVFQK